MPTRVVAQVLTKGAEQQLADAGVNVEEVKPRAVQIAGDVLFEKSREYAPSPTSTMFPTESTGRLRDSHTLTVTADKAIIQPEVYYAVYVHEGHFTATKYMKGKAPAPPQFIAPRPWLFHAAMDSRAEIQKRCVDMVQEALENAQT